ncbi:MAG: hypothetical protein FJY95_12810 [Candidatus Handelsmanbacteria bacterium]|nr:hypothetical protein [Candidatus Handelsmanbacteria bacterium]
MRRIRVQEAKVGEVLAAPVINRQGRILLPKGAKLSPAVLSRLQGWGVFEVQVEGQGNWTSEKSSAQLLADLQRRFADWQDQPLMRQIEEIARRHLGRR